MKSLTILAAAVQNQAAAARREFHPLGACPFWEYPSTVLRPIETSLTTRVVECKLVLAASSLPNAGIGVNTSLLTIEPPQMTRAASYHSLCGPFSMTAIFSVFPHRATRTRSFLTASCRVSRRTRRDGATRSTLLTPTNESTAAIKSPNATLALRKPWSRLLRS